MALRAAELATRFVDDVVFGQPTQVLISSDEAAVMNNETTRRKKAYPANAPGEFYVEDQCCTLCGVPQKIAPELFSVIDDASDHCYVRRQPTNEDELARMLKTISDAELQCIRYAGTERSIQVRLVEAGEWAVCDHLFTEFQPPSNRVKRWLLRVLGRTG